MGATTNRFDCPTGGAVERGRKRLRGGLAWLAVVTFTVALAAVWVGRIVPALLAAGAAGLTLYTRRVSADLDPLYLELRGGLDGDPGGNSAEAPGGEALDRGELAIQMRRWRETVPLEGARARQLDDEEIEHLTRLATAAHITAGTGGFDSHRLGELDLYASDMARAVLVEVDERAVVVTPDDPDRFVAAISRHTGAPRPLD